MHIRVKRLLSEKTSITKRFSDNCEFGRVKKNITVQLYKMSAKVDVYLLGAAS